MNDKRTKRIEKEIKKEVALIISTGIKDPRVGPMVSVTDVDLSNDLEFAKIYISTLGDDDEKQDAIDGLENATGFIKRELGIRLKLRHVPDLIFKLDESIERGIYMNKLIDDVLKADEENRQKHDNDR